MIRGASIVLTGFMGTGKTIVGQRLAYRLGREFLDMDAIIVERENKSVREIFDAQGEEYFREREKELCEELASRKNLVIATGGGALVSESNRDRFSDAFVVCLDASVDVILERLEGAGSRPLLSGGEPRQRIEDLLNARREAYSRIPFHINTNGKSPDAVAEKIIEALRAAE